MPESHELQQFEVVQVSRRDNKRDRRLNHLRDLKVTGWSTSFAFVTNHSFCRSSCTRSRGTLGAGRIFLRDSRVTDEDIEYLRDVWIVGPSQP